MSNDGERLRLYSDYVCPFCYLGRNSLETYRDGRDVPLTIDWHPFDLRAQKRGPDGEIDHSVDDGKDEAYFERVRENVAKLKDEYGADEMLALEDTPDADSLDAQVVSLSVQREYPDRWERFDRALFEALWVEGRDIGDPAVLASIGTTAGLPESAIETALEDDELRDEVFELFADARRDGVTGVPTFVCDGYAARGAVPPAQLERLIEGE